MKKKIYHRRYRKQTQDLVTTKRKSDLFKLPQLIVDPYIRYLNKLTLLYAFNAKNI